MCVRNWLCHHWWFNMQDGVLSIVKGALIWRRTKWREGRWLVQDRLVGTQEGHWYLIRILQWLLCHKLFLIPDTITNLNRSLLRFINQSLKLWGHNAFHYLILALGKNFGRRILIVFRCSRFASKREYLIESIVIISPEFRNKTFLILIRIHFLILKIIYSSIFLINWNHNIARFISYRLSVVIEVG
jgi:hypothetical protein